MNELLLHYVWQHKLFAKSSLKTVQNQSVEVLDVGLYNQHSGPDFFNAKVRINGLLWAGNVEIHLKASDWYKHHHQNDPVYDKVILHVVHISDVEIKSSSGSVIPQLQIQVPDKIEIQYEKWMNSPAFIRCSENFNEMPSDQLKMWQGSLMFEYLHNKVTEVENSLRQFKSNWEEVFYIQLCRSLGFSVNKPAFELLAKSVPYSLWIKYKEDKDKLSALFLGQAGWLNEKTDDSYLQILKREYDFLKIKHTLTAMEAHEWKWLRMRPANFPAVRVYQLIQYLLQKEKMFSFVVENPDLKNCRNLLTLEPQDEWLVKLGSLHNSFKLGSVPGHFSIDVLVLNLIAPLLFAYGQYKDDEFYINQAVRLYDELPAEHNSIIKMWESFGVKCKTAADSQSMIFLKKNYCDTRNCLRCRIGHHLLKR